MQDDDKKLRSKQWREDNREKSNTISRKWKAENKDKVRVYQKAWREKNKEYWADYQKKYGERTKENKRLYREANKKKIQAKSKAHYLKNMDKIKQYGREYRLKQKAAVMRKYGGHCIVCKTSELAILTIDHINDDGSQERKKRVKKGNHFYKDLLATDKRDDLAVLCMSCQWRKRMYGPDMGTWFRVDNPNSDYGVG